MSMTALPEQSVLALQGAIESEFAKLAPVHERQVDALVSKKYEHVNIQQAFADLMSAGKLLQVAFAHAGHQPCSRAIAGALADYQTLVKDSAVTSSVFVEACVAAVRAHEVALKAIAKGKSEIAFSRLRQCSGHAEEMAKASEALVDKADKLMHLAKKGLEDAMTDKTASDEERQRVEKLMKDMEARAAKLRTLCEGLDEDIEEARADEARHAAKADKERERAMILSILSSGVDSASTMGTVWLEERRADRRAAEADKERKWKMASGVVSSATQVAAHLFCPSAGIVAGIASSGVGGASAEGKDQMEALARKLEQAAEEKAKLGQDLDKAKEGSQTGMQDAAVHLHDHAKTEDEKGAAAVARARQLQQQRREANSELQEKLLALQHSGKEKDTLVKAVELLEVVVTTLGKVKTTFDNTRIFWLAVQKHCEQLQQIADSKGTPQQQRDAFNELFDLEELAPSVEHSALRWVALGRVCSSAHKTMISASKAVDGIMNDLPVGSNAVRAVQDTTDDLLASLRNDSAALQDQSAHGGA